MRGSARGHWPLAALLVVALLGGCRPAAPPTWTSPAAATSTPAPAPATPIAPASPTPRPVPTSTPAPSAPAGTPAPTEPQIVTIDGQIVTAVDASADGEQVYATTDGALYQVVDGGWERRSDQGPFPNLLVADDRLLLAGAAPPCARGGPGAPLRRSVDGGRTWTAASGPTGTLDARPVPTYGRDRYAIACDGVYRSRDDGATWSRENALRAENADPTDLAITPDGGSLFLVALTEGGTAQVLRAERRADGGWDAPRRVMETWGPTTVAVAPTGEVWVGSALGVWRSGDRGSTWRELREGLEQAILTVDPRAGPLPPGEEAKNRRGAGVFAFHFPAPGAVQIGTADGVYALSGTAWSRVMLAGLKVTGLLETRAGYLATTPQGVYRVPAAG